MIKNCKICNTEFNIYLSEIKRGWGFYCSRKCYYISQKGHIVSQETRDKISKASLKTGRIRKREGYILIRMPHHPFALSNGYIYEHRYVIEKHLGRYLKPEEVVHHINNIRDDNRIENLRLFSNQSFHIFKGVLAKTFNLRKYNQQWREKNRSKLRLYCKIYMRNYRKRQREKGGSNVYKPIFV